MGAGALALRVLAHLALPDVQDAVRVTHVCDPAEGRAEAAAGRFGVVGWSRSLERLLEDPAVDAVTIASPIALHHEQGLAAIRAGKHVHFNKTMALTPEQATELIEAARAAGVRLVASPGEMLRPHNQRVKAMIADGVIGTVCWAACGAAFGDYHVGEPERQGTGPLESIDPSWYFRSPGGGPLYDMTVYALHGLTGASSPTRTTTRSSCSTSATACSRWPTAPPPASSPTAWTGIPAAATTARAGASPACCSTAPRSTTRVASS